MRRQLRSSSARSLPERSPSRKPAKPDPSKRRTHRCTVVAASPNGLTCEVDQTGNRFIEELVGPLPIRDGMLELGDRPGLGITLDEDLVRELRVDPFSMPDGNYCDVIFGRGQTRYIGDYVPKAA